MTQRDGMGRELGGGFRIGNSCTPVVDSCWCMAKPIQYCKVISLQLKFKKKINKIKMWTILKVFVEFATTLLLCYIWVFWSWSLWNLSSPTRDRTHMPPALEGKVIITGLPLSLSCPPLPLPWDLLHDLKKKHRLKVNGWEMILQEIAGKTKQV